MGAKAGEKYCYCGSRLLLDGSCRFRCDPEASPKALRAKATARKLAAKERARSERLNLTPAERAAMTAANESVDPIYAYNRRRSQKAGRKSHAMGNRR